MLVVVGAALFRIALDYLALVLCKRARKRLVLPLFVILTLTLSIGLIIRNILRLQRHINGVIKAFALVHWLYHRIWNLLGFLQLIKIIAFVGKHGFYDIFGRGLVRFYSAFFLNKDVVIKVSGLEVLRAAYAFHARSRVYDLLTRLKQIELAYWNLDLLFFCLFVLYQRSRSTATVVEINFDVWIWEICARWSLLPRKIVDANWSAILIDELVREGIVAGHRYPDPQVPRHNLLPHRPVNHLGHAVARRLEILVAVLRKLVWCVQVERVIALLLCKMLATVIQSWVLWYRPTL